MTTTETVDRVAPTPTGRTPLPSPGDATVVVFRRDGRATTYLLLHDRSAGTWCPPSGRRAGAESPKTCARRHVVQDTGLHLYPIPTAFGTDDSDVYLAQAVPGADVTLSSAHDRYEWVEAAEAASRCAPLADSIGRVAALVELG
ncbi:MAG TPA: NUDIX domain-containing protein [Acidimicrobiales bacterium]|nr:NUDIX domain-containing protein [Acidimicrobiales bacterium]